MIKILNENKLDWPYYYINIIGFILLKSQKNEFDSLLIITDSAGLFTWPVNGFVEAFQRRFR